MNAVHVVTNMINYVMGYAVNVMKMEINYMDGNND
jgi:hypothetical protein